MSYYHYLTKKTDSIMSQLRIERVQACTR